MSHKIDTTNPSVSFPLDATDDCLAPRIKLGQILIVQRVQPEPGDVAVFWVNGQLTPELKILRSPLQGPTVEFEQLNPPRRYRLPAGEIIEIFRVDSVHQRIGRTHVANLNEHRTA